MSYNWRHYNLWKTVANSTSLCNLWITGYQNWSMNIRINVECMKKCDNTIDVMHWISNGGPEHYLHPKFHQFLKSWKKEWAWKYTCAWKCGKNKTKVIMQFLYDRMGGLISSIGISGGIWLLWGIISWNRSVNIWMKIIILQSNIEISLIVKYAKRLIICKCSDLIRSLRW